MKKFLPLLAVLLALPAGAEQLKTLFNGITGAPDYYTALSTSSIQAGTGISVSTTPSGVTITNTGGGGGSFSLNASGNIPIISTATLLAGTNVTLSQAGSTITINSSGGSSTLISSGVAFGSASNTVTQDTNTFTYNDTSHVLTVIGISSSSIVQTSTYSIVSPTYGTGPVLYTQFDNLQLGLNQPTNLPNNGNNGNVLIGNLAGKSEYTTPSDSVYIGNFSGDTSTGAAKGVLIGEEAGSFANGGTFNTYIGYEAGEKYQCSSGCTMIGAQAGYNSGGSTQDNAENTCVGSQSCGGLTAGFGSNTALGYEAMGGFFATGGNDTSIGFEAGMLMQGTNSISIGDEANVSNANIGIDGVTVIGEQAEGTAIGDICLGDTAQTFGAQAIAIGVQTIVDINATGSMAFGHGTHIVGANSIGFGTKDITGSPLVVNTTNTFVIGQIGTNEAMQILASSMTIATIQATSNTVLSGTTFYKNGQAVINGVNSSTWLTGNQSIALSGDSSGSGTTAITVTASANQPNIKTLSSSSVTVSGNSEFDGWEVNKGSTSILGPGGLGVTYGVSGGSGTFTTSLTVAGQNVCQANGTNCPASSGSGGYAVQPATVTFLLNDGFTASSGTFTSSATFNSSVLMSSNVVATSFSEGVNTTFNNYGSSGTITPDATQGNNIYILLHSSATIAAPINAQDRQRFVYSIAQDGAGSRNIVLSGFGFGTSISTVAFTSTASKEDELGCVWRAASSTCLIVSPVLQGY